MPTKLKPDSLGSSRLSRVLERLKSNSPGYLPSLISLKVTIPQGQTRRTFLEKGLPGLYYLNPACKISVESPNISDRSQIACKFVGRKEEVISLQGTSISHIFNLLRGLDKNSVHTVGQVGLSRHATNTVNRSNTSSKDQPSNLHKGKHGARLKARKAWEFSRLLDSM